MSIQPYNNSTPPPGRYPDPEGYHAAWFKLYAVCHYCPRHSDKLGVI